MFRGLRAAALITIAASLSCGGRSFDDAGAHGHACPALNDFPTTDPNCSAAHFYLACGGTGIENAPLACLSDSPTQCPVSIASTGDPPSAGSNVCDFDEFALDCSIEDDSGPYAVLPPRAPEGCRGAARVPGRMLLCCPCGS